MSEAEDASGKGSNLTAVESISARLAEVTRLAEKLDARLCEAGARTRPVPMSSSAMSSTSSLFSSSNQPTTTVASSCIQSQPISTAISSFGAASSMPLISSSESMVPFGTKGVCTVLATKNASKITERPVSPAQTNAGAVSSTGDGVSEEKSEDQKMEGEDLQGAEVDEAEECREKFNDEIAEEAIEKSCDESLAEDSNVDGYVTATECSITPTARSRSESFVTSPECEDLATATTVASVCESCWNMEEPKSTTSNAAVSTCAIKQEETSKGQKAEKHNVPMETLKPEIYETNGEKQVEKLVALERRIDEKSGKIVKEVTETTTLRVSHDTRLGIASYKVISNTTQDHRENVDVKEIKDIERIISPDVHEKTNGLHHDIETGSKTESYTRRDELSTKTDDTERSIKYTKICELSQEEKPRMVPGDTSRDITLFLKEYTRHHEDSGIEMSPTKKEENLEGQDFLEKARKVSSIEVSSMNGHRKNECCCSCKCNHEAACFDRYTISVQQNVELNSANENRRCLSLSNAS